MNPLLETTPLLARMTPLARGEADVAAVMAQRSALTAPKGPGVYAFVDAHGVCVYVGKSRCLAARLAAYLRVGEVQDKAVRIRQSATTIYWEELPGELAALLREIELIHYWEPRLNVQFHPHRRRGWVALTSAGGLPKLAMVAQRPAGAAAIAGPFSRSGRILAALDLLNDALRAGVRPAAPPEAFCREAPPADDPARLAEARRLARALLRGDERGLERRLRAAMAASAAAEDFEGAAAWRDEWRLIAGLRRRIKATRRARASWHFVYPVRVGERRFWYLIRGGLVHSLVEAMPGPAGRRWLAAALRDAFGDGAGRRDDALSGDHLATMIGWFRRRPEELGTVMRPEEAWESVLAAVRSTDPTLSDAGEHGKI